MGGRHNTRQQLRTKHVGSRLFGALLLRLRFERDDHPLMNPRRRSHAQLSHRRQHTPPLRHGHGANRPTGTSSALTKRKQKDKYSPPHSGTRANNTTKEEPRV
ncbi:hypothetical protein TcCL_Unassigned02042 [Trypanosoma cruzi]|nr:hypothetical protein TcCL_Unassigned02042 [Trypanosoma cruzi]